MSQPHPPPRPGNITITPLSGGVVARWDSVPLAFGPATYNVAVQDDQGATLASASGLVGNSLRIAGLTNGVEVYVSVWATNADGSSEAQQYPVTPTATPAYRTIQQLIFEDIAACVGSLVNGLLPVAWPNLAFTVVHDDVMMNYWPPQPDQKGLLVMLGPGDQTENQIRVSNADSWQETFQIALSMSADCLTYWTSHGAPQGIDDLHLLSQYLKDLLIRALRADRQRGRMADWTSNFAAKSWAMGDGTLVGYLISFEVRWRTNVNDPTLPG